MRGSGSKRSALNTESSETGLEDDTDIVGSGSKRLRTLEPVLRESTIELTEKQKFHKMEVRIISGLTSCVHEVALPPNTEYEPLQPRQGPPLREYKFVLDSFQQEAILCIDNLQSVLVSAHTSAGKTVIAE